MMGRGNSNPSAGRFDDRNIEWRRIDGIDGMEIAVCSVDRARNCVDFLARFEPGSKVLYHRHLADTHTFIIDGDHVIYEPDGSVRESRPVGLYTATAASDDVHSEGGGQDGCVILYSARGQGPELFEMLDEGMESAGIMSVADFEPLMI